MSEYERELNKILERYEEVIELDTFFIEHDSDNKYTESLKEEIYLCENAMINLRAMAEHYIKLTRCGSIMEYMKVLKYGLIAIMYHLRYRIHNKMYI